MIYNYYLGLGSNIEPRLNYLQTALIKLAPFGRIKHKSSIYDTQAWGNTEQDDFYNAVIEFDSALAPRILLETIKRIEAEIGRRSTSHWGPREIDIDIIYCRNLTVRDVDLMIPHRYAAERRFILAPLCELNGNLSVDGRGTPVRQNLRSCQDSAQVSKLDLAW
jgi:2-amino-4-hydroxy-6-hydroxymethyldihydropteridine diphosphokinase